MLEHAVYSVISPEGCASILWRDSGRASEAAQAMKITATDLQRFGIIDQVVPEPPGGAHSDHEALFRSLDAILDRQLRELGETDPASLPAARYEKFRRMGRPGQEFLEAAAP
jgi:acetyl-CoA carboxylase carboxyl transferase subunit alpha